MARNIQLRLKKLIKFTPSSELSRGVAPVQVCKHHFSVIIRWHTKHFPPGEQSKSENWEYISNGNEIIRGICEVAVNSQSTDEISAPVKSSELAVSRCE